MDKKPNETDGDRHGQPIHDIFGDFALPRRPYCGQMPPDVNTPEKHQRRGSGNGFIMRSANDVQIGVDTEKRGYAGRCSEYHINAYLSRLLIVAIENTAHGIIRFMP